MVKTPKKARLSVPLAIVDLPDGQTSQDSPPRALSAVPELPTRKTTKLRGARPRSTSKKGRALKTRRTSEQIAGELSANPSPSAIVYEDRLARLATAVRSVRAGQQLSPRTTKLLTAGISKMAQKLVEEAAETAIEAVLRQRTSFVNESADLLYNLVVLWTELAVTPAEVWAEMDRREAMLGLAEKLPKTDDIAG